LELSIDQAQARRFLLYRQGLMGARRFSGKEGALEFIRQAGCIQFDPVDVCGRNAELVLQSRVKGFTKSMLDELLYRDRRLVDFFDKNLSIFPMEDWPYLRAASSGSYAEAADAIASDNARGGDAVRRIIPQIRKKIRERGYVSAKDIETDEKILWYWGMMSSLPRAALESLYFRGELVIHHKKGMQKSYAFAEDCIPSNILRSGNPFKAPAERFKWRVLRRIGAIGLLWNRASDAWLGMSMKTAQREAAFASLLAEGKIFPVQVEGIQGELYGRSTDRPLLDEILAGKSLRGRTEFLAPLDNLLWDRKLIKALFGFDYKWEIYTPVKQRKYGAYTLPILHGDNFYGRVEAVCDRKSRKMKIQNLWLEHPASPKEKTEKLRADFRKCAERFAKFNGCETLVCDIPNLTSLK
jgi:uncharacterized protein YcaQ